MSGLLNLITGGENEKAQEALRQAMAQMQGVSVPTANDLQLSPLQQYYETGQLTPALMEAAQSGPSAYDAENLSTVPTSTMQKVLGQLDEIASSNGMTPQEQAAIARDEADVNRNTAGQRGAISADFAQRGVPQSLISAALQNGTVGQNAQTVYEGALTARANAANNAQNAMTNEGALAGKMYDQQSGQANTVAAAQNALDTFNANNTQAANAANQGTRQAANTYNTTNRQNIGNENVTNENQRQINNQITAKTTAAQLALEKAGGVAGVGNSQANQAMAAGQQAAGLASGLIGAGATLGAAGLNGPVPTGHAEGGEIPPPRPTVPATNFVAGGPVPGQARVAGNDPRNDTVPARLSPGEFVVPRTAMARPDVRQFLAQNVPTPKPHVDAHPSDVASLLKALSMLRGNA